MNTDIILQNNIIIKYGEPYNITNGKFAGQQRNMYWEVKDKNSLASSSTEDLNKSYIIMHIIENIYTKISKEDINKVLNLNDTRPSWYINDNGYIGTTIRTKERKQYYLHQLIMDVHDEDLTNYEKTVDHVNNDKLDNRRENLRLVNMSIQNSNRPKSERRCDACDLPAGIIQSDLPKYVIYGKEMMNKESGKYREYFYISNHPKLEKSWCTTKSEKVNIIDKLQLAKNKILELEGELDPLDDKELNLPNNIRLINSRDKQHFVFD